MASRNSQERRSGGKIFFLLAMIIFVTAFHDGWGWLAEWFTFADPMLDTSPWWVNVARGIVVTMIGLCALILLLAITVAPFFFGSFRHYEKEKTGTLHSSDSK